MKSTISLSVSQILERVYAHSAAEIVTTGVSRPEVLGRDHDAMLRVMVRDAIATVSLKLSRYITGSNIAGDPIPELITLDMELPSDVSLTMLRIVLETAVAAGVLSAAWRGSESPMSERYLRAFDMNVASIMSMTKSYDAPGYIEPMRG